MLVVVIVVVSVQTNGSHGEEQMDLSSKWRLYDINVINMVRNFFVSRFIEPRTLFLFVCFLFDIKYIRFASKSFLGTINWMRCVCRSSNRRKNDHWSENEKCSFSLSIFDWLDFFCGWKTRYQLTRESDIFWKILRTFEIKLSYLKLHLFWNTLFEIEIGLVGVTA